MNNLKSLRASLEYLETYLAKETRLFQSAPFLKDDFDAEIWNLDFGLSEPMIIDFRIEVNKTSLINCLDGELCRLFKLWICAAGTNCSLSPTLSNSTMRRKVSTTINVIDWLLMNAAQLSMHEHGLKLLNSNDIKSLLAGGCSSPYLSTTVYSWPRKLKLFLQNLVNNISTEEIERAIDNHPILTEPWSHPADDYGEIEEILSEAFGNQKEIITIRAALWVGGFYVRAARAAYIVDTRKIAKILYQNTLGGIKAYPPASFFPLRSYRYLLPEFPRVPTRAKHTSMLSPVTEILLSTFDILRLLREHSSLTPKCDLEPPSAQYLEEQFNLSKPGRFTSLPITLTLNCLRAAIEFYLEFGKAIISSYLRVMRAFREKNIPFKSSRKASFDISALLDKKITKLNVTTWNKYRPSQPTLDDHSTEAIYASLRSTPSLHELMQVLFGAIQITLGILQARRASELRKIIAQSCLSEDSKSLETVNRKSGLYGINVKITRPIPYIAADMIRSLEDMQKDLMSLGLLDYHREVLSCPLKNGSLERIHPQSMQSKFDIFCDYFQTSLDSKGRRYYVRQHQLRRFFAQAFFWHQGEHEDKLDILRWILGHGDSEMIYHYITESTPGQILREVKAEWGAQMLKTAPQEVSELSVFLQQHYGSSDFAVLPEDQLEEYISYCISKGTVQIEPEFLTGPDGTKYKIIVTVKAAGDHP